MDDKKIKIPSSCRELSIIMWIKGVIDGKKGIDVCKAYMSKVLYSTEALSLKSIVTSELEVRPLYIEAASIISKVQTIETANNPSCKRRNNKYKAISLLRLREIDEQINSYDIVIQQKLYGIKTKAFSKISAYIKGANQILDSKIVLQNTILDDNVFKKYKAMHAQSDNERKGILESFYMDNSLQPEDENNEVE